MKNNNSFTNLRFSIVPTSHKTIVKKNSVQNKKPEKEEETIAATTKIQVQLNDEVEAEDKHDGASASHSTEQNPNSDDDKLSP